MKTLSSLTLQESYHDQGPHRNGWQNEKLNGFSEFDEGNWIYLVCPGNDSSVLLWGNEISNTAQALRASSSGQAVICDWLIWALLRRVHIIIQHRRYEELVCVELSGFSQCINSCILGKRLEERIDVNWNCILHFPSSGFLQNTNCLDKESSGLKM